MTPRLDELPPVVLPERATVEIPGLIDAAGCWLVPGQDWQGYSLPYFDHEQLDALLNALNRRGLAAGQVDDRGVLMLAGPAVTGVYEIWPVVGLPEGRDAERVWPVGAGRWPWRERSQVAYEVAIRWPVGSPTPGILHVEPDDVRPTFDLVARLADDADGVTVATGLSEADAERMAMVWNQTLCLDGLALAGGILERIANDESE